MAVTGGPLKTLGEGNQFSIICPIFHEEALLADCFKLRDLVWAGKKPAERCGCQIALTAGKCPVPAILQKLQRSPGLDPYASNVPVVGKLDDDVLRRIAPVIVREAAIEASRCTPEEKAALLDANDRARSGAVAAPVRTPARKGARVAPLPKAANPVGARSAAREPALGEAQDLATLVNTMVAAEADKPLVAAPIPPAPKPAPIAASAPIKMSLLERARLAQEAKRAV